MNSMSVESAVRRRYKSKASWNFIFSMSYDQEKLFKLTFLYMSILSPWFGVILACRDVTDLGDIILKADTSLGKVAPL